MQNNVPQDFYCPLSLEIMFEPVVASDGETYERDMIEKYFNMCRHEEKHQIKSPIHNTEMTDHLVPNRRTASGIKEFITRNPQYTDEIYFCDDLVDQCMAALLKGDTQQLKMLINTKDKRLLIKKLANNKTLIELALEQKNIDVLNMVIEESTKNHIRLPHNIDDLLLKKRIENLEYFKNNAVMLFKRNLKTASFKLSQTWSDHTSAVTSLFLLPNNQLVSASWGKDANMRIWDIDQGTCMQILPIGSNYFGFLSDGRFFTQEENLAIKIWDSWRKNKCIQTLKDWTGKIVGVKLLPDGELITMSDDYTFKIWDIHSKCLKTWKVDPQLWCLHLLQNGRLACGYSSINNDSHLISIWDIAEGKCIKTLKETHVNVNISNDDNHTQGLRPNVVQLSSSVLSIHSSNMVNSAKKSQAKEQMYYESKYYNDKCYFAQHFEETLFNINCLQLLPDGRLASGDHSVCENSVVIRIWDINSGECVKLLKGKATTRALQLMRDGRLISGDTDGMIKIWDTEHGKCIQEWQAHSGAISSLQLLPDGRLISGSSDKTIKVWTPSHFNLELSDKELKNVQEQVSECRIH